MAKKLDFAAVIAHLAGLVGSEASVVVMGRDPSGDGVVAELTGVLRAVGPDPDDPHPDEGPRVFGFEGQASAFYLDPDAFVDASASEGFVQVELTFGTLEVAGPLRRPNWF